MAGLGRFRTQNDGGDDGTRTRVNGFAVPTERAQEPPIRAQNRPSPSMIIQGGRRSRLQSWLQARGARSPATGYPPGDVMPSTVGAFPFLQARFRRMSLDCERSGSTFSNSARSSALSMGPVRAENRC
jgi:hypothetical protein